MFDDKKLKKEDVEKVSGGKFEDYDTKAAIDKYQEEYRSTIGYGKEVSAKIYQKFWDLKESTETYTLTQAIEEFKSVDEAFAAYLYNHTKGNY